MVFHTVQSEERSAELGRRLPKSVHLSWGRGNLEEVRYCEGRHGPLRGGAS